MSVEETQQPSFTVTAGVVPPDDIPSHNVPEVPRSPSPSSYGSVANRFSDNPDLRNQAGMSVEEEQSESLQQWTQLQQKANEGVSEGKEGGGGSREDAIGASDGHVITGLDKDTPIGQSGKNGPDSRSSSAGIPDPVDDEDADRDNELDNVSSPTDSSPVLNNVNPARTPNSKPKPSPSIIKHARTPLQPVNDYSPHKSRNFAMPSPSRANIKRRIPRPRQEQDSFAEDRIPVPRPPAERLAQMLEGYKSAVESSAENGTESVPKWDESDMKPDQTLNQVETAPEANGYHNETINGHVASDPSQASQSVPQVSPEPPDPSLESPTRRWLKLSTSPASRSKRFNRMLDSQSSESMPGDMQFSQHDDLESQHSMPSVPVVATQSIPRQAYESSPAASPEAQLSATGSKASHATVETTSSSLRRQSMQTKNTQEATQLVTDDELVTVPPPPQSPVFEVRRSLPSARAWRAGRGVISQPTARLTPAETTEKPNTVAAPQAVQAQRQATAGPPLALEDTYIDPIADPANDDAQARPPTPGPTSTSPSPSPSMPRTSPLAEAMRATFVDPTMTSLPVPPPERPTPKRYGKQRNMDPQRSPGPEATSPLKPPPTAGPSRLDANSNVDMEDTADRRAASPANAAKPAATKSGRVPKRKRRDSSASMSGSSSSSEELDPLDESYRPASKTGSGKVKSSGKPINPNLKRVKRTSRSSSLTSRRTSSALAIPDTSTPLTTPPPSSPAHVPVYVLAYWHPNWFIGRIRGMQNGRYEIDFEDETFTDVAMDRVRRGTLRKGDKVKSVDNKSEEYEVTEDWSGDQRGVKIRGGRYIALKDVFIRNAIIKTEFTDRIVTPRDLGFDADIAIPPTLPVARPASTVSDIFAGKVFFITSMHTSDPKYQARQKKFVDEKIIRNGGKFLDQWEDLFDLPTNGFGSTLAKTSAPFLLQETQSAALTPKMLVSLAKGIPCLSVSYIEDAIQDPSVDWRSYLVESGYSERYQQHCSQVVSGAWGKNGWNAATAQAERRPFLGKSFLFLVPKGKKKGIKSLVLVCLHTMGAANVEIATKLESQAAATYDYVLVHDRDEKRELPGWARSMNNVCNIQWLKQCLVMGAALKPGLLAASE